MKNLWGTSIILAIMGSLNALGGSASGAGLALFEQSAKGAGTAYAGGAAAADDASTVFYNPAGLVRLPGTQVIAGLQAVVPSARFRNEGSTHVTGQPLRGTDGGDAGIPVFVPDFYASHRVSDRFSTGVGVFSPFGFKTKYDASWVGRYQGTESDAMTVNLNPAAYRLTDKLSLGAGLDLQYARAELDYAVDFGTIFAALGVPGMAPQENDGFVTFKGDSLGWGYNLGLLYQFSKEMRAGIAYRSKIEQELKGDARFSGVPSPNPTGQFLDTGITADATLPDSVSLSFWHAFSKEVAAMADVTWTRWETFKEIRIRFDNPAESDAVTTTDWQNSFRFAAGLTYTPGPWAFRAGMMFDETPVPNGAHATPLIPDSDRTWMALGLGYAVSDTVSLNAGYAHLFVKDAEIRRSATGEDQLRGGLSGTYDSKADIVSAELAWVF
ncbi:MAG: porin [Desulfobacteraceae bacterium]|nr:porin [Desulfobacteraceae bacterium]